MSCLRTIQGCAYYRPQMKFLHVSVILSTGESRYDVTSCLAAWSYVPSGEGDLSRILCPGGLCLGCSSRGSLSVWGVAVQGGLYKWVVRILLDILSSYVENSVRTIRLVFFHWLFVVRELSLT